MKKKILILGANGMLGHDLADIFLGEETVLWDINNLDITDQSAVEVKIRELHPDIVINAAAYTDVDGAQDNIDLANKINGFAVGYLASACRGINAVFVHFSTEYVFSGNKAGGYIESDAPDPINAYGQSKALGEKLLQENCEMFYLIRSSWLYGKAPQIGKPRGMNFVETMLKLSSEKSELKVVNDQFGKPTYTKDLAAATKNLIEKSKPCGIYHLANEPAASWFDFAKKIFELKGVKINLLPISSSEYTFKTPRPKNSVLINSKTELLRDWSEALSDYLS